MRIIAGLAKGKKLTSPRHGTRPMTGKARESIFSILSGRLPEAHILDLFAGTGSLGLEALSRGASSVVFVDKSRKAESVLQRNIDHVGLGGVVRRQDVESYLRANNETFDIIFCDPPYAMDDAEVDGLLSMTDVAVGHGGIMVLHRQARSSTGSPDFLDTIDVRHYGDAVVTMMERRQSD